jgi:hypothetical protein
MPMPTKCEDYKGTWACNGAYVWRCYSSGGDQYATKHPHVPAKNMTNHQGIPGSAERYSYRGVRATKDSNWPVTIQSKFMQCYCRTVS